MERLNEKLCDLINEQGFCFDHNEFTLVNKALKKFKAYEDAEEQGLLLRLPCKEGSRVYEIVDDCNFGSDCYAKRTCNSCEYRDLHVEPLILATKANIVLRMPDFGKTWFLTEAEAKAALAEKGEQYEK